MKNQKIILVILLIMQGGMMRSDQSLSDNSGNLVISLKVAVGGLTLAGGAFWYLKSRSDRLAAQQQEKYKQWAEREAEKQNDQIKNVSYGFLDILSSYAFNGSPVFATIKVAMRSALLWWKNKDIEPANTVSQLQQSVDGANFTAFSSCIVPGYFSSSKYDPNEVVDGTPTVHRIFDRFKVDYGARMRWMECLEKNGKIDWNAKNRDGYPLLQRAIFSGDTTLVSLLKRNGARSDVANKKNGMTALHLVAEIEDASQRMQIAYDLLRDFGSDLEVRDNQHNLTPLAAAALLDRSDLVNLYLLHGASIEAKDSMGNTSLFHAVRRNAKGALVELLRRDAGQTINEKNNQNDTPLCRAIRDKNYWVVRALKATGMVDMSQFDKDGKTPVQLLLDNNDRESLDILSGLKPDLICNSKELFNAAVKNKKHLSAQFLFDVFLTNEQRRKAVIANINSCNIELIRDLVASEHINLSYADTDGDTLLHLAAMTSCQELYSVLRQAMESKGIDCNVEGSTGETAGQVLDSMKRWEDKAIAEKNKPWWKKLF